MIWNTPIDGIVGPGPDYPVGEDLFLWSQLTGNALSPLLFEVTARAGEAERPLSRVCAIICGLHHGS